ncbi:MULTISPECIES: UDP-3-O-(3-hydroxymyristoyl)glucosamine N-acyltransferase [Haematobacter]|uniref:UDP-3-O-acylglucosamine N-acyltransferase n=1 Tax=Haematobacter genomosp. 1 TaxID=366618 RepID=A0A212AGL5_9RHOB|nr:MULTISPECIES: UDP-3-O-(3-hydroxymyristoyl)glucosamine N-acyltransferase [Haematobacter]OWJ80569.1 UDP-3-O-(3-hydroxymyristoyl)glucosamine N-acyltransferase [Haematobacter genomosp. 1]
MDHTVTEIAAALDARVEGDGEIRISGVAEPQEARADQLAVAMDPKYADGLVKGHARAAILWADADWESLGLDAAIFVTRPRYAMSRLTGYLDPGPGIEPGIHPLAYVHPEAEIGADAAIGPFAYIGRGVRIGARARIAPQVFVGEGSTIGDDALLQAGVRIAHRVTIGDRFIGNPGCVIGGDGFSFVTPEKSGVEEVRETPGHRGEIHAQKWTRISSVGGVEIGDDVEVGCNACVDRGTIRATRVGNGTKIDNLVQVGHNCQIGEDCLLCGMVGVAGSVKIGNRVVLGGGVGVNDNIFIGDDVIAGGAARIFTNAPAGRVLMGTPAVKMETQLEINKAVRRLPRMAQQFADLQKRVSKLDGSE